MKWPKNKLLISMLHCHPRMQTLFTVTTPFYSTLNSHLWKSFLESLPQKTICCLSFRFSFTRWKILVLSISNQFSCYNTKSTCKPKGAKTLTTQGSIGEAVSKTAFVLQEHTVQGKGRAPETPWYKAVSKSSTWGKRQEEYKEFNEREKKLLPVLVYREILHRKENLRRGIWAKEKEWWQGQRLATAGSVGLPGKKGRRVWKESLVNRPDCGAPWRMG